MAAATVFVAMIAVAAQPGVSAQTKTAVAKPAPAKAQPKAAPAKAAPRTAPAKAAVTQVEAAGSVTMTGCLEADGRSFMLTDIEGAEAPKGRSWKTGFVTKTSKDMELIGTVKLGDYIGRRVSVVGVADGESRLTTRSIKQLAASCA
jgi:hypothetical protein